MGVRGATLSRNGVHPFHILAAQVIQLLGNQANRLVRFDAWLQELIQILIRCVHHGAGLGEKSDLLRGLNGPSCQEDLLAINHADSRFLKRDQDGHFHKVNAQWLPHQAVFFELSLDLRGDPVSDSRVRIESPPQGRDSGPSAGLKTGLHSSVVGRVRVRV